MTEYLKSSGWMTNATGDLTCQEIVELVTDYVEETMPGAERRRFDVHVERCADCETYLAQMRATVDTLGAVSEESLAPDQRIQLLNAFRGWRRSA